MSDSAEIRSAIARTLNGYRKPETPEERFARQSRGGKATALAKRTEPEGRVIRAYAKYVQAWKVYQRKLERNPKMKPVNVPDPTGIDIHKLLEQQAKQPK